MTTQSTLGAALFGAMLLCAGVAHAQDPGSPAVPAVAPPAPTPLTREQIVALADYEGSSPADHATALVDQIVSKLQETAADLGIPTPAFDLPVLQTMVTNAMPEIPDDREIPFSYAITIGVKTRVQSTELADADDGVRVLRDSRGCGVADIDFQVVHFSRLAEDDYVGHHCILTYDAPEGRMMRSQFYMRNATREVLVDYDFVVGLGNSYDASEIVAERTLNANIVLSQAIGVKGLDMVKAAPAPAD
ncbi:MAG: hypothetical protein KAY20_01800 [Brevundimonas sp.]|nr:hypothetical protein [Brevundimonas sp.]